MLTQKFARDVMGHFAGGKLKPIVDVVMPMSDVRAAHERMEQNTNFGKIVLAW